MWKRLHRRRSTTAVTLSSTVLDDDEGEQTIDKNRDKMALVLPLGLNTITADSGQLQQQALAQPLAVGEDAKQRRPLSPRPLELQNSNVSTKQKRRRSLLGGLIPRLGGSPTNASFAPGAQTSGEASPPLPPAQASVPSNSPSPLRPRTPSRVRSRPSTPHTPQRTPKEPTPPPSATVATPLLPATPNSHASAPTLDTSAPESSSRSRTSSFSNNTLPMRLIIAPSPPLLSKPPRPPRRSPKRPSTAPSPTSTSPSIFASASDNNPSPRTPRSVDRKKSAEYFVNAKPDWTRANGHRPFSPDAELNRKSVASDLTTSTADTVTPRPPVYHADGRTTPGANAGNGNQHGQIQETPSYRTKRGAWPPLTPFGARVTAVMESLSPTMPSPANTYKLRAVTLPHNMITQQEQQGEHSPHSPHSPSDGSGTGSAGTERRAIPSEWISASTGVGSSGVSSDQQQRERLEASSSELDASKSDEVPLVNEGASGASRGGAVLSRKAASASAGVITRTASAAAATNNASSSSEQGHALTGGNGLGNGGQLMRSKTVGNGALHHQAHDGKGAGGVHVVDDPRQIAFERRERARNVWRARKMAQVFGSEPPAELLQSMSSIAHSQSLSNMLHVNLAESVDLHGAVLEQQEDDKVNGEASRESEKEDGNQSPTSISSPPSSSGLHTPDSSLDLGSPIRSRFGDKLGAFGEFRRPSNDIAEEDEEETLRAEFRIRRMRARKLERFFGVPAPKFQEQIPVVTKPSPNQKGENAMNGNSHSMEAARTPTPTPMKQPSMLSMAPSTAAMSSDDSTSDLLQRVRSRSSIDSRRSPIAPSFSQQQLPQHTANSHSISTSAPYAQANQIRGTHGYSQSQSNVEIGVERTKRWPPLTAMVKDSERERARAQIQPVDERDAEQMRDVMARLRKLR